MKIILQCLIIVFQIVKAHICYFLCKENNRYLQKYLHGIEKKLLLQKNENH